MASIISHAIFAVGIGKLLQPFALPKKYWFWLASSAMLPDADSIGYFLGVPYASMFGHRGITHSMVFALLWAIIVVYFFFKNIKPTSLNGIALIAVFFLATLSHGVLDAFTNGGLGVGFFIPFTPTSYFFRYQPIVFSPISITSFFSQCGLRVIKSEMFYIWIPSILLYAFAAFKPTLRQP